MAIVEPGESDVAAVGRDDRRVVRAVAAGERYGRAAVDADAIHFAIERLALPVLRQVRREEDGARVGRPRNVAARMGRSERQLRWSAAIRRHPEDLVIAGLQIALVVG